MPLYWEIFNTAGDQDGFNFPTLKDLHFEGTTEMEVLLDLSHCFLRMK